MAGAGRAALPGDLVSPAEAIAAWRLDFGSFWPKGNRFYGPLTGLEPGADLMRLESRTGETVRLPPEGLVISKKLNALELMNAFANHEKMM